MSADDEAEPPPVAPTVDAALDDVVAPPTETFELETRYEARFTMQAVDVERGFANLLGLRDHFRHKKYWSWFLMTIMAFMVVFQSLVIWMVGGGYWDFTKYAWLLPTLMIQYLAQIAGLALVAVRSLFKDIS